MSGPDVRIAVVDLGSNSVRLLLCDGIDDGGPSGERLTRVTGLRRGAGPDGAIAREALERLDACLAAYAERVVAFAPSRVVVVGTSAVRDAPNRALVADLVGTRLGADLTVLSGEQEAGCAFAGARLGVGTDEPIMVVDIGGASTELVSGGPGGPEAAVSLQLGAVRQTDEHLASDPPTAREIAALRADAIALVAPGLAAIGGPRRAVGVAGTITTLAAIELGVYDPERVHGHALGRGTVDRLARDLAAMTVERRREVPGLDPARAGVIVAGAIIASVVLAAAGRDEITVSEKDLLDGVVLALADPSNDLFRS